VQRASLLFNTRSKRWLLRCVKMYQLWKSCKTLTFVRPRIIRTTMWATNKMQQFSFIVPFYQSCIYSQKCSWRCASLSPETCRADSNISIKRSINENCCIWLVAHIVLLQNCFGHLLFSSTNQVCPKRVTWPRSELCVPKHNPRHDTTLASSGKNKNKYRYSNNLNINGWGSCASVGGVAQSV
jgi:hypothetical protein